MYARYAGISLTKNMKYARLAIMGKQPATPKKK